MADHPIVIIGCGFGGVCLAINLKRAGIENFVILERAKDIGGVWRDNSYPGCACDVPSVYYSYSFEQDYPWSAWHAPWNEILAYIKHCATKYDVIRHVRLDTQVASARFDETRAVWRLDTKAGETIEASHLVSAVGLFGEPTYPDIPGRENFEGMSFHSSQWRHDYDLRDKRVAAIGVGASAIQYVPRIAPLVKQLHVAQRTAQYVRPRDEGTMKEGLAWFRATPLYRRRERQRLWAQYENGYDLRIDPAERQSQERAYFEYLERVIPDPVLRDKLTPKYPLGCKRVLASNDFYPAMQRANVELVTDPIAEITATGLRTKDGRHREVDAIIYSTGFKPAEYLSALKVHGLDGREIHDVWDGAPQAYVGAAMHGFPNFFMLYGPHTNGSGSIIYMLEAECEFVTKCIVEQRRRGADMIQPGAEAQRAYNVMIDQRLEKMPVSLPGCNSYFKTKTGKIATQWPARMSDYDHRARHPDWNDFLFETTHAPQRAAPVLEPAK